jgi:cell wall assembly regulator SMI1
MDLSRLFRRGNRNPEPTDDTIAAMTAILTRLTGLIPGELLLRLPATDADLTVAETHLGQQLPADVRALYRLHDGQHQYTPQDPRFAAGLFTGEPYLPLHHMMANWDDWAGFEAEDGMDEFAASHPEGFVQPKYSTRGWIPLTHDGSGNHIGVDLNPAAGGVVGQVITFGADDDEHQVLAPSLLSYLEQVADLIESGDLTPSDDEDDPDWTLKRPLSELFHPTGKPVG